MQEIFRAEAARIAEKIRAVREETDVCFALLSDTRLCDRAADTAENIAAVDALAGFDCVIHLGDILTGNNPKNASGSILAQELALFRGATAGKQLFITGGEADGYRNERFMGQMVHGIFTNGWWHSHTAFMDGYGGVSRPGDKPYYFADIPEKKTRMVFLYAYTVQLDENLGLWERTAVMDVEQIGWLATQALAVPAGWTVLLFSHCLPKSRFETGKDPFFYKGNSTEQVLSLVQKAQRRGVAVGGWFAGHYHCDGQLTLEGIPFVVTDGVYPQPGIARCEEVQINSSRGRGTREQDLWDAVVVKPQARKIHLLRFGAGSDRIIEY